MFNDYLNFSNNIYDNLHIRNDIEAYKNLCEQLQAKIDLLEAGLKAAMKSGDPAILKKEAIRQGVRQKLKQQLSGRANLRAQQLLTTNPNKAGIFASKGEEAAQSARALGANIEEIEMQLGIENPEVYKATRQAMSQIAPHSSNATY
jgi:hypothetical protein